MRNTRVIQNFIGKIKVDTHNKNKLSRRFSMITFKYLLGEVDFKVVWESFTHFYPELKHRQEEYLKIFNLLRNRIPNKNEHIMVIHIDKQEYNEENDKVEYRVHGKDNGIEWDGYYDISSGDWDDWLSYCINDQVFNYLSKEEIVALCLYELTWFGFDEESIRNNIENIVKDEQD